MGESVVADSGLNGIKRIKIEEFTIHHCHSLLRVHHPQPYLGNDFFGI